MPKIPKTPTKAKKAEQQTQEIIKLRGFLAELLAFVRENKLIDRFDAWKTLQPKPKGKV